jgi:calcineurin-like phosphoesterase family protein
MAETVWFTADTHFWHARLLGLGRGRPFASIEEHNETLIDRWNDRVGSGDRVYHLGDFSFGNRAQTEEIIGRLHGQVHFVRGNHDRTMDRFADRFASYSQYKEIKLGDQRLVLFHFPIHSWHKVGQGAVHLHGHSHGLLPDSGAPRLDVGVDDHGFAPISFEQVMERMGPRIGTWTPGDHHGPISDGQSRSGHTAESGPVGPERDT